MTWRRFYLSPIAGTTTGNQMETKLQPAKEISRSIEKGPAGISQNLLRYASGETFLHIRAVVANSDGRYGIFWRQSDYHVTRKWCALLF
jgi:hypothetical protein